MQSSIHVARWVRLLEGAGFDVVLFPVIDAPVHPLLRNVDVLLPELVVPKTVPGNPAAASSASRPKRRLCAIGRALAHLLSRRIHSDRPQNTAPRSVWTAPLVLRYPRRALIQAINIARYGHPDSPRHVNRPANLNSNPARRLQALPKFKPRSEVGGACAVRLVPLRLTLEDLGGHDPRATKPPPAASGEVVDPWFAARALTKAIAQIRPDLIHSMEFQHCAYLVLEAKGLIAGAFPRWLASNWGSDIHHFAQFDDHRRQIVRVLENLDFYAAECERDVALARNLGYVGPVFPIVPSSGGFDLAACTRLRAPGPTSARRIVVVKGYQHFVGRALTALQVVADNADLLAGYEVLVYSATPDVVAAAQEIRRARGIDLRCLPRLSHDEMLAIFGRARIYIGLSESDAISTGVLEAMVMGALPIQTNTSCCNEWFADGEGGFIVDLKAPGTISERLRRALQDDALVDRAAAANWEVAQRRLDIREIQAKVVESYGVVLHGARHPASTARE